MKIEIDREGEGRWSARLVGCDGLWADPRAGYIQGGGSGPPHDPRPSRSWCVDTRVERALRRPGM